MTNESKKITPAIDALLRSPNDLLVHDIREMNHLVPDSPLGMPTTISKIELPPA